MAGTGPGGRTAAVGTEVGERTAAAGNGFGGRWADGRCDRDGILQQKGRWPSGRDGSPQLDSRRGLKQSLGVLLGGGLLRCAASLTGASYPIGGMAGDAVAARSGRDAARRAASRPKSALRAGGRRPRQMAAARREREWRGGRARSVGFGKGFSSHRFGQDGSSGLLDQ